MKDKFPEIYKNKVENLKSKVQKEYYYHADDIVQTEMKSKDEEENVESKEVLSNVDLISKINSIFKRPDYVYKVDVNIMYKNGKTIMKKVIGFKNNYLITNDGEKIYINEISDIN